VKRDELAEQLLVDLGWQVFTIWECETKDTLILDEKLRSIVANILVNTSKLRVPATSTYRPTE